MNEARFWSNVDKSGECWLWTGHSDGRYGRYGRRHGRDERAHRIVSELVDGPIPDGVCVLRHCDVTLCVRPSHLFRGTQRDNIADMVVKGRARGKEQNGELNTNAKLTIAAVLHLRALAAQGLSSYRLGALFGVSQSVACDIAARRAWRSVPLAQPFELSCLPRA